MTIAIRAGIELESEMLRLDDDMTLEQETQGVNCGGVYLGSGLKTTCPTRAPNSKVSP